MVFVAVPLMTERRLKELGLGPGLVFFVDGADKKEVRRKLRNQINSTKGPSVKEFKGPIEVNTVEDWFDGFSMLKLKLVDHGSL